MNFNVTPELIIQIMESKPTLTIDGYKAKLQEGRIEEMVQAIAQVQASVNWYLQMPKAGSINNFSPSSHEISKRIENPAGVHLGPAILGAIICGFPIGKHFDRIGIDRNYYQKWLEVRLKGHESVWLYMYGG